MVRLALYFKAFLLFASAKSHVLVEDSYCTKTSDSQSGVCKAPKDCPGLGRRGSLSRRRSRRFSCLTQNLVCCPFGARRASVLQEHAQTHNERCGSVAAAGAPDPGTGCCGREALAENRIIGGSAARLEQYPWMALLQYRSAEGKPLPIMCGGFLVSSRYVVTARHCVAGAALGGAKLSEVRLAEHDRRTPTDCLLVDGGGQDCVNSTVIKVDKVIRSPGQDLALIRLQEPAPYTDFIRPICLPTEDVTSRASERPKFSVAGWGVTDKRPSPVKMHVQVPFVPLDDCRERYKSRRKLKLNDDPICAGGEAGRDSCHGDSGGPLMYDNGEVFEAVGVVSFGPGRCGQAGAPAVHVNVLKNRQWILDNMEH